MHITCTSLVHIYIQHIHHLSYIYTYNIYLSQVVPELEALTKNAVLQMESNFDHWERLGY